MATISQPEPSTVQLRRRLLDALEVQIERAPLTGTYKFGIFIVAAAMLMLPLIYFGLLFAFSFGVYWHAVNNAWLLDGRELPLPVSGLLYVAPLVAGPVLTAFMLKPFFVRQAWHVEPQRLKREAEPFLFEYVERVCEAVGAPYPHSIRVTCEANAAAAFRRGLLSLLGNDLTLIVGLPLVAGLTLRQFTGVLAHEFGHFSQGGAMRLKYVIVRVNDWFARVAYGRDAWDDWLERMCRGTDLRIRPLFYAARLFVWLNRWLMWGIMMLGHVISCYVAREQEFDADRYTCRLVGSNAVGPTLRRVEELSVAYQKALSDLRQFWDEGRLADNLPKLIAANLEQMPPELRKLIRQHEREAETGLFDTHPADRDRAAAAREEGAPGVFRLPSEIENLSATVLFSDFDRLARIVTLQFYRENIAEKIQPAQLHPVEALIERQKAEIEAGKALRRYFQTDIPVLRPLPISADAGRRPADPEATGRELAEARRRMLEALPEYEKTTERYRTAESRLFDTTGALALLQAGLRIRPADFHLTSGSKKSVSEKNKQVRGALDTLAARLLPFEEQAARRLSAALQLLQLTRVQKRIEGGDALQQEVSSLLPEAQFVSELMAELPTVRLVFHSLAVLFSNLAGNEQNQSLHAAIVSRLEALHTRLSVLYDQLGTHLYPFDHARADMTLREYALPAVPDQFDVGAIMPATEQMFDKLVTVQMRLFARLALAAERVETALGLSPLPDPEKDESSVRRKTARAPAGSDSPSDTLRPTPHRRR